MVVFISVTVLVGLVCMLDLILTLGVVRRLREHTELLSRQGGASGGPTALAVGEEVGSFETSTMDGEMLDREILGDSSLVAFFSPQCAPCQRKLPSFVQFAESMPGGRNKVLAVITGKADEAAPFVAELAPVARVVVESNPAGPLSTAFKVQAFPTVLRLAKDDAGRLVVSEDDVELDRAVRAA